MQLRTVVDFCYLIWDFMVLAAGNTGLFFGIQFASNQQTIRTCFQIGDGNTFSRGVSNKTYINIMIPYDHD